MSKYRLGGILKENDIGELEYSIGGLVGLVALGFVACSLILIGLAISP